MVEGPVVSGVLWVSSDPDVVEGPVVLWVSSDPEVVEGLVVLWVSSEVVEGPEVSGVLWVSSDPEVVAVEGPVVGGMGCYVVEVQFKFIWTSEQQSLLLTQKGSQ